jgi:hypothetical protein
MSFPDVIKAAEQAVYNDEATAKAPIGAKVITPTGRVFRYALVGAADLITGNANQASLQLDHADNDTLAIATSVAVGDSSIVITNGGQTWTLDELKYGNLNLERTEELGYVSFTIWGNTAQAGAGSMTVDLWPGVTFDVALTAGTSVVGIAPSPWNKVIIGAASATVATGVFAGTAMTDATLAQYCYLQTGGLGATRIDTASTPLVGEKLVFPATVAGSLDHSSVNIDYPTVAHMASAKVDDNDFGLVYFVFDS